MFTLFVSQLMNCDTFTPVLDNFEDHTAFPWRKYNSSK